MFEIRSSTDNFVRKIVKGVIYLFLIALFVSIFSVVLTDIAPEHSGSVFCMSGLIVFFFILYLAYWLFAGVRAIALIENMIYIKKGTPERANIDLNYTRKLVFSKSLRKMSVTDVRGKKKEFGISDLEPENVQMLINELSEVADRYGFLLVDENSNTTWGRAKGHGLKPDRPSPDDISVNSKDDTPYRVK